MTSIEKAIQWFNVRNGKVSYSMTNRLGPTSCDCSSAVYFALMAAGFLPLGMIGNTETLFNDLENFGWEKLLRVNGSYPAKRGDIFIWGTRGNTLGAAGHTGIFWDDQEQIIHCNFGYNGISINDHDTIWNYNGQPDVTIYRFKGNSTTQLVPSNSAEYQAISRILFKGIFYPDRKLSVSADTEPDDRKSPAVAHYEVGQSIVYDSYCVSKGYVWISYIANSGNRRYVAIGPDDGQTATTWGSGFCPN